MDAMAINPPTMMTDRLILRPLRQEDAEHLLRIRADAVVAEQYGQEPYGTLDQAVKLVREYMGDHKEGKAVMWVLVERMDNQVIGECCIWNIDPEVRMAEVGYELLSTRHRKGLMSEAMSKVLEYGFGQMELKRIEAFTLASNQASRKLLLGLGFVHEGTLRRRASAKGMMVDEEVYGLLKDDWAIEHGN